MLLVSNNLDKRHEVHYQIFVVSVTTRNVQITYQTSSSESQPRKVELTCVHSKNVNTVSLYT